MNYINKDIELIEPFDGVRKSNARKIFGILLIIIIVDLIVSYIDKLDKSLFSLR